MSTSRPSPNRGEIWLVDFDPTRGTEIQKIRPAVVISADGMGRLPIKLVAPLTDWKPRYLGYPWHVKVDPDSSNGLAKTSSVDAFQIRGVDTLRFTHRLGRLSSAKMEEIVLAIGAVIEYP
ncbi:MAG: type II toxin-antitoxin system PemK/MazF family toxin [Acidobacteriota bacterium]